MPSQSIDGFFSLHGRRLPNWGEFFHRFQTFRGTYISLFHGASGSRGSFISDFHGFDFRGTDGIRSGQMKDIRWNRYRCQLAAPVDYGPIVDYNMQDRVGLERLRDLLEQIIGPMIGPNPTGVEDIYPVGG